MKLNRHPARYHKESGLHHARVLVPDVRDVVEKPDIFMMISTFGVWLTSVKIDQMEPNRLQKRLRNDLLRLKLKKIEQIGSERVAYFTFAGFRRTCYKS